MLHPETDSADSDCITKFMISTSMEVLDSTAEKGYVRYGSIDLFQGAPHT